MHFAGHKYKEGMFDQAQAIETIRSKYTLGDSSLQPATRPKFQGESDFLSSVSLYDQMAASLSGIAIPCGVTGQAQNSSYVSGCISAAELRDPTLRTPFKTQETPPPFSSIDLQAALRTFHAATEKLTNIRRQKTEERPQPMRLWELIRLFFRCMFGKQS